MSTNDILTLVAILIGGAVLLWVNIKLRKSNLSSEELYK